MPPVRCVLASRQVHFRVKRSRPKRPSPSATMPARCTFMVKTGAASRVRQVRLETKKKRPCPPGAFYGQEATMPARCVLWSRSDPILFRVASYLELLVFEVVLSSRVSPVFDNSNPLRPLSDPFEYIHARGGVLAGCERFSMVSNSNFTIL